MDAGSLSHQTTSRGSSHRTPSKANSTVPLATPNNNSHSSHAVSVSRPGVSFARTFLVILLAFCTSSAIFYWKLHRNVLRPSLLGNTSWNELSWLLDDPIKKEENTFRSKDSSSLQQQQDYANSTSNIAYAFVIGGCDPDYAPSYQNYLFNIAIAAKILHEHGSKADIVALFQVSQKSKKTNLPYADLRILHALGVYVYMIPPQPSGSESFYRTQLDKFRILGLTQYQRILFMDGDVMP